MDRRRFISGVALGLVAVPRAASAQQPAKVPRIGYLATTLFESAEQRSGYESFRKGLRELGYIEGQNIVLEVRAAGEKSEQLYAQAVELVRLKVDVLVATNSRAALAAQRATSTIPIVVPVMGDPVGDGLVANLARPGGNTTGLAFLGPQLVPKRLALLKEALPAVTRVAAIWHAGAYGERTMNEMLKETEAAAQTLGVQLRRVIVAAPDELDRAFATIPGEHAEAIILFASPMLFTERRRIVDLAAKYRLPLMTQDKAFVVLGALMSYGANLTDQSRRSATVVDRILKGAKPGDLPIEQPTKFELVLNLKTAKALGITIPQAGLLRADEVIQ